MKKKNLKNEQIDAPETKTSGRRHFFRKAAAAAILGSAAMSGSRAGAAPAKEEDEKRLPLTTPIHAAEMGLDEDEVKVLTPAANKLTKGDLLHLRDFFHKNLTEKNTVDEVLAEKGNVHKLTFTDVHSINEAFVRRSARHNAARGNVKICCCCCPCCSCTASVVLKPLVA
jgi:hypothetical protein